MSLVNPNSALRKNTSKHGMVGKMTQQVKALSLRSILPNPHDLLFSYQGVELFERIRKIRRHDFVEQNVSQWVGFEGSKVHACT